MSNLVDSAPEYVPGARRIDDGSVLFDDDAGARQVSTALGETAIREGMGAALRMLQQSAAAAGAVLPAAAGLERLELANKLEAFERFQQASAIPHPAELGTYPFLWTAEGLGYAWAAVDPPRRFLERLPDRAAIPLHTGAALFFATRLLETDRSATGLEGWLALWAENALPGYRDLAAEALGLVARNLYPYRVQGLGDWLQWAAPDLAELFWHGVGRGLYFAPTHALPWSGAAGRAFRKACDEPPHEPGRLNATAGLSWALTLVNIRHPEVLADVLWRHGHEIASGEAFANRAIGRAHLVRRRGARPSPGQLPRVPPGWLPVRACRRFGATS